MRLVRRLTNRFMYFSERNETESKEPLRKKFRYEYSARVERHVGMSRMLKAPPAKRSKEKTNGLLGTLEFYMQLTNQRRPKQSNAHLMLLIQWFKAELPQYSLWKFALINIKPGLLSRSKQMRSSLRRTSVLGIYRKLMWIGFLCKG
jgi:hypothetical protein